MKMKIKTSELIGTALDWAVAKCEGFTPLYNNAPHANLRNTLGNIWHINELKFSTNWAQGGPIIERAGMEFSSELCDDFGRYIRCDPEDIYLAKCQIEDAMAPTCAWGPTHLIAAMRCYVAANLGAEVDVPEELT